MGNWRCLWCFVLNYDTTKTCINCGNKKGPRETTSLSAAMGSSGGGYSR